MCYNSQLRNVFLSNDKLSLCNNPTYSSHSTEKNRDDILQKIF